MDNKKELIKFIEWCISADVSTKKIGDLRWNFGHYAAVPNLSKYDNLTIGQYIIYYQIERMEELGYISDDIKKELIALYDKYLEVNEKIGKEALNEMTVDGYKSSNIRELHSASCKIKSELMEYHLDIDKFDLQQAIDNQIAIKYGCSTINKTKKLEH